MKKLFGLMLCAVLFSACEKEKAAAVRAHVPVDNTATRYAAGLATAAEKAKISVEKANRAIAAEKSADDQLAQEMR